MAVHDVRIGELSQLAYILLAASIFMLSRARCRGDIQLSKAISPDPRTSRAALKVMDAAERLIGERGLHGVSLREIGRAAGQGNTYAVQYHFGDLRGLVRAIQVRRLAEIDGKRAEMLAELQRQGRPLTGRQLVNLLFMPLLGAVGEHQRRNFARFSLAILQSPHVANYSSEVLDSMPAASKIIELVHARHPELPMALLLERQRFIAIMVLNSVFSRRPEIEGDEKDALLIDDALEMAAAALIVPPAPSLKSLFET